MTATATITIPALTLWQPWATLIAIGEKRYETRSWSPDRLGWIAIHAAAKCDNENRGFVQQQPFRSVLAKAGIHRIHDLPFGQIVAMARFDQVDPTGPIRSRMTQQELAFGDFREGRFAWRIAEVKPLTRPIAARGLQKVWAWTPPSDFPVAAFVESKAELV